MSGSYENFLATSSISLIKLDPEDSVIFSTSSPAISSILQSVGLGAAAGLAGATVSGLVGGTSGLVGRVWGLLGVAGVILVAGTGTARGAGEGLSDEGNLGGGRLGASRME